MFKRPEAKFISQTIKHSGNWLVFKTISLEISDKTIKDYEYIDRPATKKLNAIDGVSMVPIITSSLCEGKKVVIVANYRPPIKNFILEFPGGIVESDSFEHEAFRELKEETGYFGKKILMNFKVPAYYDAWKSKENGRLLIVEIDGDDERNQVPVQELDETEVIKVFLLDFDRNLMKKIEELSEKHGFAVADQLYSFAMGLAMNSMFGE